MTEIVDQQPPIPTTRRPAWDIVVSYTEQVMPREGYRADLTALVLADMRARDAIGRERYKTALTSGNGRDHLVDALQEGLDGIAYIAAELDEHGIGPSTEIEDPFDDAHRRWLFCVQQLFAKQVYAVIQLRGLIQMRDEKQTLDRQLREVIAP